MNKRLIPLLLSLFAVTTLWGIPPAKAADNLVPNPSVEVVNPDNAELPLSWQQGYNWGDLDASYQYLNSGYQSSRSVSVSVTRYVYGDVKWYFAPVAVQPNQTYTYSDYYRSDTNSSLVVAVTKADQSTSYIGLPDAPAEANWTKYSASFATPAGAVSLSIYHVLAGVGSLTTDNFSLVPVSLTFERGLVSLTFDDGWASQYQNGQPLLSSYHFPATFYIITGSVGQSEYMSLNQLRLLSQNGHEIGSHTVHHYDLTTLTLRQIANEFSQAKSYLEKKVTRPITDLAYPYGAYNTTVMNQAKKYYRSARSSDVGLNNKATFNQYRLRSEYITPQTTLTEFQGWLDQAQTNKEWLIIMYHQVDNSGSEYSVTPSSLNAQLQALQASNLPVLSVNKALDELLPQL